MFIKGLTPFTLVIVTYRPEYDDALAGRLQRGSRCHLGPLGAESTGALLDALARPRCGARPRQAPADRPRRRQSVLPRGIGAGSRAGRGARRGARRLSSDAPGDVDPRALERALGAGGAHRSPVSRGQARPAVRGRHRRARVERSARVGHRAAARRHPRGHRPAARGEPARGAGAVPGAGLRLSPPGHPRRGLRQPARTIAAARCTGGSSPRSSSCTPTHRSTTTSSRSPITPCTPSCGSRRWATRGAPASRRARAAAIASRWRSSSRRSPRSPICPTTPAIARSPSICATRCPACSRPRAAIRGWWRCCARPSGSPPGSATTPASPARWRSSARPTGRWGTPRHPSRRASARWPWPSAPARSTCASSPTTAWAERSGPSASTAAPSTS